VALALASPTLRARLEAKTMPIPWSGCHIFLGALNSDGYGHIGVGSWGSRAAVIATHQAAVLLAGRDIPEGFEPDHKCRVRSCINPDHLEVVTHRVNIARGQTGEHLRRRTHCPRGHPLIEGNLCKDPKGRSCLTCHRDVERKRRERRRAECQMN
jgi:hypothetical protein